MFQVEWTHSALERLAGIWLDADPSYRPILSESVRAIDRRLLAAPTEAGESRAGDRRIMILPPLAILFRVQPRLKLVTVGDVWRIRCRGNR